MRASSARTPLFVRQERVDVEFDDLRNVGDQMRQLNQRSADRADVRWRPATVSGQQLGNACARDEVAREHRVKGRQADRAVGGDLDGCATLAEENDRAEHGIRCHADDELMSVGPPHHGLHGEPLQGRIGPILLQARLRIAWPAASTAAALSRSRTTPPTSDLCVTSGERILSATGKPISARDLHRLARPSSRCAYRPRECCTRRAPPWLQAPTAWSGRPRARPVTTACAFSRS